MRPRSTELLLAIVVTSLGFLILGNAPSHAAPTPQENCVAQKLTAQSSYLRCLYKADRRFIRTGDVDTRDARRATCAANLTRDYQRIDKSYGAACPAPGLVDDAEAYLEACEGTAVTSTQLGVFPTCGDGAINVIGELCDGSDVGSTTCAALGYASGTLACKPDCTFDTSGCVSACTTYSWATEAWSPCSVTCGTGIQHRSYFCERNPGATRVDQALCADAGPPPATAQYCNVHACPTPPPPPTPTPDPTPSPAPTPDYTWVAGPLSPCSATCGTGQQTRTISCLSLADNTIVPDVYCEALSPKPDTLLTCNTNPCV